jgi:predicted extracellular nuclease
MSQKFCSLLFVISVFIAEPNSRSFSATTDSPPHSVTVAFWNIQWFPGRRPNATRQEESRQIKAVHSDVLQLNADIIGMEEVRDFARARIAIAPLAGI